MKLAFNVKSALLALSSYNLLGQVGATSGDDTTTVVNLLNSLSGNVKKLEEESAKASAGSVNEEEKAKIDTSMNALVETCANELVKLVRSTLKLSYKPDMKDDELKKHILTQPGLLELKNFLQNAVKEGQGRISELFNVLKEILLSDPVAKPESKDLIAVLFDKNVFSDGSIAVFTEIKEKKENYTIDTFTQQCVPVVDDLHKLIEKSEKTGAGGLKEELDDQVSSAKTTLYIYIGLNIVLLLVAILLGYSIFKRNKGDEYAEETTSPRVSTPAA
ncbi:uncharacterized protein VICG_02054 [Vittaforma corneae ATCC 50505]|uniref:Uncharacterized protein n=1 Tax=Vittaforma corneae (strain ATCC 50505) TaxID=993615 RepID=L2GJV2_VITCO|nr:uncharacterized protein VICG_02054 [Vittaforma corneae ATCC 50505]ELA40914.1 hypothetical protein VICG_02054 [Vittaforma corneae ATCC 50505]